MYKLDLTGSERETVEIAYKQCRYVPKLDFDNLDGEDLEVIQSCLERWHDQCFIDSVNSQDDKEIVMLATQQGISNVVQEKIRRLLNPTNKPIAKAIAKAVMADLADRKGFDWWWEEIDRSVQREINQSLINTVDDVLRGKKNGKN